VRSGYLWSDGTNWTSGVPASGDTAVFDQAVIFTEYDDIANLNLAALTLTQGGIAVTGTLEVGALNFGTAYSEIYSDTTPGNASASLTIDSMSISSGIGHIGAQGSGALTTMNGATDPGSEYFVDSGAETVIEPAPNATSYFLFQDDNLAVVSTIAFGTPEVTVSSSLDGVAVGDAIALPGTSVTSVTFQASTGFNANGTLSVTTNLGSTTFSHVQYVGGTMPAGYTASTDPTGLERITFGLCFCRGTLFRTPQGDVCVEDLSAGDSVVTWRGDVRPITWIGTGRVLATRGQRSAATPVIVCRGAFAENVPHADLRVTKGHLFYVDGALIPVEYLVNHRSILWDDSAQEVSIYHIELATHEILLANGAPAESCRDDGNRWLFQNTNLGWADPPRAPFALVLTGGPVVDAAWRRFMERAGPRPVVPLTDDPDLHLLVDGQAMDAAQRHGDRLVFRLRHRPETVRIVSRAVAPQELGLARDPRLLGLALRRIVASQGARLRLIEADDALLVDGFHGFEPDNGFRWTNGNAAIPDALFGGFTGAVEGAVELVLHIGCTARYPADKPVRRAA